jgi:hypothetical protein
VLREHDGALGHEAVDQRLLVHGARSRQATDAANPRTQSRAAGSAREFTQPKGGRGGGHWAETSSSIGSRRSNSGGGG